VTVNGLKVNAGVWIERDVVLPIGNELSASIDCGCEFTGACAKSESVEASKRAANKPFVIQSPNGHKYC
jgi:hypothetical protein